MQCINHRSERDEHFDPPVGLDSETFELKAFVPFGLCLVDGVERYACDTSEFRDFDGSFKGIQHEGCPYAFSAQIALDSHGREINAWYLSVAELPLYYARYGFWSERPNNKRVETERLGILTINRNSNPNFICLMIGQGAGSKVRRYIGMVT